MTIQNPSFVAEAASRASGRSSDLYRAVWRWHFYAGLLVLPFLVVLAVTGALYLFRDEIDAVVHADLKRVQAVEGAQVPPSALVAAAVAAHPGTAVKLVTPTTATASAEVVVRGADGGRTVVYVDPHTGHALGTLPDKGTVMWLVRQLHSLAYFGPVANAALEIAAGWSILLVATGIYLWWPRGRGGVLSVRGTPRQRTYWRDLHAVTGIFVGFFVVFLAATGMPWSMFWGEQVNEMMNGRNFGYPTGVYVGVPMSERKLSQDGPTSWSLEQAQLPLSGPAGGEFTLDQAVASITRLGFAPGFAVSIPSEPTDVYSATVYPDDVTQQRVAHLDRYSGKVLIDTRYADYGPAAKAAEWGISVHMGQEFGLANQLVLLAACLAIVLLCVSAGVMWWKRRPQGSLGIPPLPSERKLVWGVAAILAVGGVVFPLVGASLVVMLLLDGLLVSRWARLRR